MRRVAWIVAAMGLAAGPVSAQTSAAPAPSSTGTPGTNAPPAPSTGLPGTNAPSAPSTAATTTNAPPPAPSAGSPPTNAPPPTEPSAPAASPAPTEPTAPLYAPPTVSVQPEAPLEYRYQEPKPPIHAPRFSLWTGVRLTFQTFGNSFFRNELGRSETTGSFIDPGLGTELNIGARLEKRYIPYVLYDRYWSFGTGRRFDGVGATSYSQLFGFGFRYLFGNPDFIAGFTDLSFGLRNVSVSSAGQSYSMSTFEFLRLALGAEIRLHTRFVLSPQVSLSSGVMNNTSGTVNYAPGQGDGITAPRYRDGSTIEDSTSYILFAIGTGGHFDLFGK